MDDESAIVKGPIMASLVKEIVTRARPDPVWDAISDIGALHTRLVPGFVVGTELVAGGRRVTFGTGLVVEEPIIGTDDARRRLAWTAVGDGLPFRHYSASVQVFGHDDGSRVAWTADVLPDEAVGFVTSMMEQGLAVMKDTLDRLAERRPNAQAAPHDIPQHEANEHGGTMYKGFLDTLLAAGPHPDLGTEEHVYGRLIGSWRGELHNHMLGNAAPAASVEAHFAWVLDGRAVQDVWITPARPDRAPDPRPVLNWFGTTLRVFDPAIDGWRTAWTDPASQLRIELVGRPQGDDIVQIGTRDGRPIRWRFLDIGAESFRWEGHVLNVDGDTWDLEVAIGFRRTA